MVAAVVGCAGDKKQIPARGIAAQITEAFQKARECYWRSLTEILWLDGKALSRQG